MQLLLRFFHIFLFVNSTLINFQSEINCPLATFWCATVKVYEENAIFADVLVAESEPSCLETGGTVKVNTVGRIDGDGWFDNRYEFLAEVTHTCSRSNRQLVFREFVGSFADTRNVLKLRIKLDVQEKGN
ncbi:unnamed protein product [Caenorhabditis sp. 36 PRJEB53466]|nr:unnamed protein product [Caenorhabditis sp. 36 PRJEB53466]